MVDNNYSSKKVNDAQMENSDENNAMHNDGRENNIYSFPSYKDYIRTSNNRCKKDRNNLSTSY